MQWYHLLYHTNLVSRIIHRHYICLATVDDPGLRTIQESGQHNSFVDILLSLLMSTSYFMKWGPMCRVTVLWMGLRIGGFQIFREVDANVGVPV